MSQKPFIAILTAQTEDRGIPIEKVSMGYTRCVFEAGGIPIILPNLHEALEHYVPLMDGLLMIGGFSDVHPSLYGEEIEGAQDLNLRKDEFELMLIEAALKKRVPIMGVCRGMQMLNVYFGGSLIQDVPGHFHREQFNEPKHPILVKESRILEAGTYPVNSIHHQAVKALGRGFQATGHSEDGFIEMIEHQEHSVFGVQWHPEIFPESALSQSLFRHFVASAL